MFENKLADDSVQTIGAFTTQQTISELRQKKWVIYNFGYSLKS